MRAAAADYAEASRAFPVAEAKKVLDDDNRALLVGETGARDLLARRLVREGCYDRAYPYFHSPQDRNFGNLKVRDDVTSYARALGAAHGSWSRVNRARGWYRAAVLARQLGMEMMGYETGPDYFVNRRTGGRIRPG